MVGAPGEGTAPPEFLHSPKLEQKLQGPSGLERGVDDKCLTGTWAKVCWVTSVLEWVGPIRQSRGWGLEELSRLGKLQKGSVTCIPQLGTQNWAL